VKIGVLEYRDNDFIEAVVRSLPGIEVEHIRLGEIVHPSPSPYPLVIDRVSFCDPYLREVMRYWSLNGAYVINNPFYTLTANKLSDLVCCQRLGIPTPRTILLPRINQGEDLREMVVEPDWERITREIPFPCILKPVDGYAWQDVFTAHTLEELRSLYDSLKGRRVLVLQELVRWSEYYRAFCIGATDVMTVRWNPKPFDMGEYSLADPRGMADVAGFIAEKTAALNRVLGLDFNSVEWCITPERTAYIIDAYNDVPDVRSARLPAESFQWIVERFSACVRQRLGSGARNSPVIPGLG
jgi:hypothetical protein